MNCLVLDTGNQTPREKMRNNHTIVYNLEGAEGEYMKYSPWYENTLRPNPDLCFTGPNSILEYYGFTKEFRGELLIMNDGSSSFSGMADRIEKYVEENS